VCMIAPVSQTYLYMYSGARGFSSLALAPELYI
jgi:hypothetical protein